MKNIANGSFNIFKKGSNQGYSGTGELNENTLIISATSSEYGKHDLHCDLKNTENSWCHYYATGNVSDPVKATIKDLVVDGDCIEFVWVENGSEWEIDGVLDPHSFER